MRNLRRYGIFIFCLFCLSCSCKKQKILDRRVSLWRLDNIPYGTKYAYDNLSSVFPNAEIHSGNRFPVLFQHEGADDTIRALIIISSKFIPEPNEMNSIIRFAAYGNQVFISALDFGDTVMDMLRFKGSESVYREGDSTDVCILDPVRNSWEKYRYPGFSLDPFFESVDTVHTKILGRDVHGKPDFIRIPFAHGGAVFIHLNPLTFTNFFLLHNGNKSFYDRAFSYLPRNTRVVEWSDYFRYSRSVENFSALHFILSKRSLKWAYWLTLLLFFMMLLVESKRQQRPISEIPPPRNASEDFVKTVGRLYFQQRNNQNLAVKMVAAFLENIRVSYNLSTASLNEEFTNKLAFRMGRTENEILQLIRLINDSRANPDLSDQELMDLHQKINIYSKPV